MTKERWYEIHNCDILDTPAVVVYLDRVKKNIHTLIESIDDVNRLRPHVKTHKSPEVSTLMMEAGIKKFKCATIAEAEMLALIEAPDVLLAYQPVGPKGKRLVSLIEKYPNTKFSCLIDNENSASELSETFLQKGRTADVYIDLNVGMNRTGIVPEHAFSLYVHCKKLKGIRIIGLHAYDGHIRDKDFNIRSKRCDEAFSKVVEVQQKIFSADQLKLTIIAGGSPTFSIHSKRKEIECSPGTFVYWDKGYEQLLAEQHFLPAALVVTRVVSKPSPSVICIDLGHKAIASENVLPERVSFLNAPHLKPIGHSEEHMVLSVEEGNDLQVGDILYGLPYHVCPTVALHDQSGVVENHLVVKYWETLSRNRSITI
ncbi:D-TA family PLP-dependent enzyme [Chryseolinea sp. H1M3-3]|uniref:D-TA family PLP-dependent enzyme n=1 Tax=Chryseolinea sp. H1M3-3 TaxID=3034144 RepID=UPI0023EA9E51|nr:D-TA family PLP-dependent enzyme [Chryseolinea sp. H1M3-3]